MTIGGVIAGIGGGIFAHYTTHIEHVQFGVVLATFAIAYPILGGLSNVFGTLLAVIFIQGFLIEGLRFMGDWRNLLFGGLIVLAMNVRPRGLLDAGAMRRLKRLPFRATQGTSRCLSSRADQAFRRRARGRRRRSAVARGRDPRPDRPERLRQEHDRQPDLRPVSADRGSRAASRAPTSPSRRMRASRSGIARTFQNIRLFGQLTGLAEPLGRAEFRRAAPSSAFCRAGSAARASARGDRPHARILRSRAQARRAGRQPRLRRAAAARIRARARRQAGAAAARRAGRRHERRGDRPARRPHPQAAPGRRHHPVDRAPCGAGHVGRRPHRRAQFRPEDRGRHAGRGPGRSRWCARPISAPRRPREASMLDVSDLVTAYGKIEALKGVSLRVESGASPACSGPTAPARPR